MALDVGLAGGGRRNHPSGRRRFSVPALFVRFDQITGLNFAANIRVKNRLGLRTCRDTLKTIFGDCYASVRATPFSFFGTDERFRGGCQSPNAKIRRTRQPAIRKSRGRFARR